MLSESQFLTSLDDALLISGSGDSEVMEIDVDPPLMGVPSFRFVAEPAERQPFRSRGFGVDFGDVQYQYKFGDEGSPCQSWRQHRLVYSEDSKDF